METVWLALSISGGHSSLEPRLPIPLSSTPSYDAAGYMGNLLALRRLLKRHRAHPFICVMGPPAGYFARSGKWEIPDEALEVYRRGNLSSK